MNYGNFWSENRRMDDWERGEKRMRVVARATRSHSRSFSVPLTDGICNR